MILRSILALGALAALCGAAAAQGYPTFGAQPYPPQAYPPPYRPLPPAAIPDDDDDDIPPHQRAAPGNYPPPPGNYRGPFAREPQYQAPPPVYSDRGPAAQPPYYGPPRNTGPAGGGQPESYGRAPGYPDQAVAPQPQYQQPYPQGPQAYPPPQPQYQQPYPQGQQAYPQQAYPPAYQGQQPVEQYQQGPSQGAPVPLSPVGPREVTGSLRPNTVATLPPEDQPETGKYETPPQFKRQVVQFQSPEPAGTLVIDTGNTFLFLVLGNGQAMRYGIGVGREGFTWAGAERVSRMAEWPDWHPPAEMIERQPYLPRFMAGGEGNPLGARALYLGKTLYRIHGTNQPSTIGKYVSSGCIRLTNDDIQDLYSRVQVGTRVVVLPGSPPAQASNEPPPQQQPVQRR
jgi:lipoprotein-anchoring transpeptidase ErfK/SrfK